MTAVWRTAWTQVWAWIYRFWRWLLKRSAPNHHQHYRGSRLHPVSCLAYSAHSGAHALRKPDWVREAVFALASASASASASPRAGLG